MAVGTSGVGVGTLRGKVGNIVFMPAGDSVVAREWVRPRNPRTAAQVLTRNGFATAAQGWGRLTDAQRADWVRFGQTLSRPGFNVYVALTAKFQRLHPGQTAPVSPPPGPFFGDNVSLVLGSSPGAVTLTASQANATGVVTEVLTQRLRNAHTKPKPRNWKAAGFVTFASGSLTQSVATGPGCFAVAYRFVQASTGQETSMAIVGATVVG